MAALTRLRGPDPGDADAGLVDGRSVDEATAQVHALSEGLTVVELRGPIPGPDPERVWRSVLEAVLTGLAVPERPVRRRRRRARSVQRRG